MCVFSGVEMNGSVYNVNFLFEANWGSGLSGTPNGFRYTESGLGDRHGSKASLTRLLHPWRNQVTNGQMLLLRDGNSKFVDGNSKSSNTQRNVTQLFLAETFAPIETIKM